MELPSKTLQKAVDQLATLPGIGQKTALRLTLFLLHQPKANIQGFSEAFKSLAEDIIFCKSCHNITDHINEICDICADVKRDQSTICVVENIRDLLAIERTMQYRGIYHILGGVISPMEGISPSELKINSLLDKVQQGKVQELLLALPTTMEGDTTNFYVFKKVKDMHVKVTILARGVGIGDELEYTDELTLGRSILHRLPYESSLVIK